MQNVANLKNSYARSNSGLAPFVGTFGKSELIHLLRRTMFGVTNSTLDALSGKSLDEVVSILLTNNDNPNDKPLVSYYDKDISKGQEWVTKPDSDTYNLPRITSFKSWWIKKILKQSNSITEKMVLFWHNHFATETFNQPASYGYWNNALIRTHHMGNFRTFLIEMTKDPMMLKYLNGTINNKIAPDENYGRELQELFTTGKDLNPHYTEDDVKAAAKVLTGFQIKGNNATSIPPITKPFGFFEMSVHDNSNKQFSAFYGNKVIQGKQGIQGETELEDLIDMILLHPETAKYICRKLYRFFVFYDIDASVESNVIEPLADIFRMNNYAIKPVLEALFKSEHFYDIVNKGVVIKSPLDHNIGMLRELEIAIHDDSDITTQYYQLFFLNYHCTDILQNVGDPPNVAGWNAYYQAPLYHEYWLNTYTLPKRRNFANLALTKDGIRAGINTDLIQLTKKFSILSDPDILINSILELYIPVKIEPNTIQKIKINTLLNNQTSNGIWKQLWNDYNANPNDLTIRNEVLVRLKNMYFVIFNLNEYQMS
jgi:uncharacterized protein (DUF1800 family)